MKKRVKILKKNTVIYFFDEEGIAVKQSILNREYSFSVIMKTPLKIIY